MGRRCACVCSSKGRGCAAGVHYDDSKPSGSLHACTFCYYIKMHLFATRSIDCLLLKESVRGMPHVRVSYSVDSELCVRTGETRAAS